MIFKAGYTCGRVEGKECVSALDGAISSWPLKRLEDCGGRHYYYYYYYYQTWTIYGVENVRPVEKGICPSGGLQRQDAGGAVGCQAKTKLGLALNST